MDDEELQAILDRRVDVRRLLRRLEFTEETVINAALTQAKLYKQASIYRVQKLAQRTNAETKLDLVKAEVALRKREAIDKKDRTETEIKDMVALNPKHRIARRKLNNAVVEEQFAKMLVDAYDMRMQAIRVVAQMAAVDISLDKRMKERAEELGRAYEQIGRKYGS